MAKLTISKISAAKPSSKEYMIWDETIPGFGLRIYPSGVKSYLFQYRSKSRTRRIAIGRHGVVTPHSARTRAIELLNSVYKGDDPSANRHALAKNTTVSELCDLYLAEGCSHKKPSTISVDKGRIARHIKPLLGNKVVSEITSEIVDRFMRDIIAGKTAIDVKTSKRGGRSRVTGGKGTASRTTGLLGGIFTFAIRRGLCENNPVRNIHKPKDNKRERFLDDDEFSTLWSFLENPVGLMLNQNVIPAIKLLLFTGCRKSEILTLKWSYLDLKNRYALLPDSKTGEKKVPLSQQAVKVLKSIPNISGNPFVLSGTGNKHYTALQKDWSKVRNHLGFVDLRIHDLRHSFASILASQGASLLQIGALLGHADPKTTQIYAHLVDTEQLDAMDQVGEFISKLGDSNG